MRRPLYFFYWKGRVTVASERTLARLKESGKSIDKKIMEENGWVATCMYYTDDEGNGKWRCSHCGKIFKKNPYYKNFCSNCGFSLVMES